MPEVNISGPAGRIEARYHHNPSPNAPVALILHPHPQFGGTMNNQVVYHLYYAFQRRGFSVLRFNFRGVGRSEGLFDNGPGELADAATALDWMQAYNADAPSCWIAGVSFGAWIAMQLLMRRPEVEGFISVAPPANLYDFTFLAPCPSSGLMVNGAKDRVVPTESVRGARRPAEDAKGHRHRARHRAGGEPFLRGPHGRADGSDRRLSRQAARQAEEARHRRLAAWRAGEASAGDGRLDARRAREGQRQRFAPSGRRDRRRPPPRNDPSTSPSPRRGGPAPGRRRSRPRATRSRRDASPASSHSSGRAGSDCRTFAMASAARAPDRRGRR